VNDNQPDDSDLAMRRRRILYRAWHRGMREMDLIMGRFADAHLAQLDEEEIAEFERLIELVDKDLFSWISGSEPVPAAYDTPLFRRIRNFHADGAPARS